MAIGLAIKSFIDRLGGFVVGQSVRRRRDDKLGDRENRRRLAARAFLEGYEPDPRLFAKGPDDAPDVFMPEPLVEPVDTYLPPQPQVPQLVPAGVAATSGEEVEYLVREVERTNANIDAIALAMRANAEADSQYRQSIIQQQKNQIAQKGSARSKRRSGRARGVRNFLRNRTRSGRKRVVSTFEGMKPNLLAFAALETIDQIQKNFDDLVNMLPEQIRGILGLETKKSEQLIEPTMGPGGINYAGVDLSLLPTAVGAHEGDYDSFGVEEPTKGGFPLGRYQFMTYRDDVKDAMRPQLKYAGYSDQKIEDILRKASVHGPESRESARIMLNHFPDHVQDELFQAHARKTIDQIISKNPNATPAEIVNEFGRMHLGGSAYRPGSKDSLGTTVEQHGENIMNTYLDLLRKQQQSKQEVSSLAPVSQGLRSQQIAQLGGGIDLLEPSVIDMRTKSQQLVSNSGASSDFDVASVSLDPTSSSSEYASIFGVG